MHPEITAESPFILLGVGRLIKIRINDRGTRVSNDELITGSISLAAARFFFFLLVSIYALEFKIIIIINLPQIYTSSSVGVHVRSNVFSFGRHNVTWRTRRLDASHNNYAPL